MSPLPPTRATIEARLVALAQEHLGSDESVDPHAPLDELLDSVERLGLVVAIEDEFEVCFEPEDDEAIETLDQAVTVLMNRLQLEAAGA